MYRLQSRPLWQRVKSGPAFAIDFIQNPAIPAGWTFNRSSPATYFDSNCVMQTAGNDVARFDHDPASAAALGLRLESGRANYLIRSDAPELWTLQTASVNIDATLSLDGKTPARKLIASASTATPHSASQTYSTSVSAATVFSYYVRLKPRELTYALIELSDSTSANFCGAAFDLISGDVIGPVTYGSTWKLSSSSCIALADGWKQVMISGSVSSASAVRAITYLRNANSYSFPGDGTSGFLMGGAQLELGTSTSYIPTAGGTGSRNNDFLTTSDLHLLDPEAGTLVFDGAINGVTGGGMFVFSLDDGVNNGISIYKVLGSGILAAYSGSAGSTGLGVSVTDGQRFRAGVAWSGKGTSASASANGRTPVTVADAHAVTPKMLCIGSARNHQFVSNLLVRSLTYWPGRMSDAELAAATRLTQ